MWVAFTIHTKPRRVVTTYDPNDDVISQARKECGLTSCPPLARMNRGRFDSRQRSPSQRDPYLPTCPAGFANLPSVSAGTLSLPSLLLRVPAPSDLAHITNFTHMK